MIRGRSLFPVGVMPITNALAAGALVADVRAVGECAANERYLCQKSLQGLRRRDC